MCQAADHQQDKAAFLNGRDLGKGKRAKVERGTDPGQYEDEVPGGGVHGE